LSDGPPVPSRGIPEWARQDGFDARFDWGPTGLRALAPVCSVIVVVDVLSFTTSVSIAVSRGAEILPYRWEDDGGLAYADERGAVLAGAVDSDACAPILEGDAYVAEGPRAV
jgi:hypothetical protein